jgi:hypothetical protein
MSIEPLGIFGEGKNVAIIAICNLEMVSNKAYATHLQFAYRLSKDNPDWQFILFTPYRMTIANFRNMAAVAACESGAKYLMFIDDDAVLINQASICKALKDRIDEDENKHIIMPVVRVRGYPFDPMFFKWVKSEDTDSGKKLDFYTDFKDQETDENGLLEVAAIGCHTCLIKTEILFALDKPYFLTSMNHTEDVYFCMKCHDYIENIGIYVATDLSIGHLLDPIWVDELNVETMREFYEKLELNNQFNLDEYYDQPKQLQRDLGTIGEELIP